MKKILLTFVCMLATVATWAYTFMDDNGICYGNFNSSNMTCYVSCFDSSNNYVNNGQHYTGDVVIPEKVTYNGAEYSVKYIDAWAFNNCSSMTSIKIPANITSIGWAAFNDCTSLNAVYIQDLSTWCGITFESSGSNPLYYGKNLYVNNALITELAIPDDIRTIKSYAFAGCSASSVQIHEGVSSIGYGAFYNANVQQINVPTTVNSIGQEAFRGCSSLTSIVIPDGVQVINSYTFCGCSSLVEVSIPQSVVQIGEQAFRDCVSLKRITLPEGLTKINGSTFYNCYALEEINIPANVTSIGNYAFYVCKSLNKVHVTDIAAWCKIPFSATFTQPLYYAHNLYLNGELVTDLVVPEGTTTINDLAFCDATCLNSVSLPSTLTSIGENAFFGAGHLDVTVNSATPFEMSGNFGNKSIFLVPETAVETYKAAWPEEYQHRILAIGSQTDFEVETTARENSSGVMDEVNVQAGSFDAMYNVLSLKVKGSINGYDIMTFRDKMLNLRELDLSEADIVANNYEYYQGQHTTDSILGAYSFYGQKGLKKVVLPKSITAIGNYAFYGCTSLIEVDMPNGELKTINGNAFYNCSALRKVTFADGITSIGNVAFYNCTALEDITLPSSLLTIGSESFSSCKNLRSVKFPPQLTGIGGNAFSGCSKLESVMLPTSVKTIDGYAFSGCSSLREVKIPAAVKTIGENAFNTSSIRDIYTWTVVPTAISQNTFSESTYLYATVHVPAASWKTYYWGQRWSQFQKFTSFNDPYEYFYLPASDDMIMDEADPRINGVEDEDTHEVKNPDADMDAGSGLVVEGDDSQNLGEVNIESNGDNTGSIIGGNSSTETSGANVNIDNLKIQINITANRWYFFAFPFDIPFGNIHFNGQFVWRYYDGGFRAEHGGGAWKNVDGELKAGRGYIFQASKNGTLTLNIGKTSIGGDDKFIALESHFSLNAQDASWNLVGNPFTSYFELSALGYNAPITIWDGSKYVAYSPQDDDLTIYPFQAFFVQKPQGTDNVEFGAAGRETRNQSMDETRKAQSKARRMARAKSNVVRELVNIEVSDGENSDKTRVVFNETCGMDYEMECDAAKFFTANVPQIYTLDTKNVQYAINERPTGTGTVKLGFMANEDGEYTISATRMDCPMMLRDLELGITHRLSEGAYTFQANSGEYTNRFELVKGDEADGITSAVEKADGKAEYYGVNGVKSGKNAKGVLIEKGKTAAKKVVRLK